METSAVELPLYQCHKQVRAAKITGVEPQNPRTLTTTLQLGDIQASTEVSAEWHAKHNPTIGSYYVQYADGYTSCSPAKAFEEGYMLLPQDPECTTVGTVGVAVEDWKTRVRIELAELVTKITKLEAYLEPVKAPPTPQPYEVRALFDQLIVMRQYRDILALRIHNF